MNSAHHQRNLNRLLSGAFTVIVLLLVVVQLVAIRISDELSELTVQLYQHPLAVSNAILAADAEIMAMRRDIKDLVTASSQVAVEQSVASLARHQREVLANLSVAERQFLGDPQEIDRVRELFTGMSTARQEVIALVRSGRQQAARAMINRVGDSRASNLLKRMDGLIDFAAEKANEFLRHSRKIHRQSRFFLYWIMGLTVALTALVGILVVRHEAATRRRLVENEARLGAALDATGQGVWEWNLADGAMHFSEQWARVFGYDGQQIEPRGDFRTQLIHPDDRPRTEALLAEYRDGRRTAHSLEHRMKHRNGGWRWISSKASVVGQDAQGRATRIIGADTDITAQKLMIARQRTHHGLALLANTAGGLAHEINTPLQFIRDNLKFVSDAMARLLAEQPASGEDLAFLREELPSALQQSEGGLAAIGELATALRTITHPSVAQGALFSDLVAAAVLVTRHEWMGVAVLTFDAGDSAPVPVDMPMFGYVVVELIRNATDAVSKSGAFGKIQIRTFLHEDRLCICVADTGVGMQGDMHDQLLRPLFTTKTGQKIGFGLNFVHSVVVEELGGSVDIVRNQPRGTRITVAVPVSA